MSVSSIHVAWRIARVAIECSGVPWLHKCMSFKSAELMEAPCLVHCVRTRLGSYFSACRGRPLCTNSFQLLRCKSSVSGFALCKLCALADLVTFHYFSFLKSGPSLQSSSARARCRHLSNRCRPRASARHPVGSF